jgi:hypothetical protein
VLILSVLIILALGVAVAAFIGGGPWLLAGSAGLVLYAFYLSRRTSRIHADLDAEIAANDRPVRERLVVTIDNGIIDINHGRHREHSDPS